MNPNKKINFFCNYDIYRFIREYVLSFLDKINGHLKLYENLNTINFTEFVHDYNIVPIQFSHLPFPNKIVLNIEQVTKPEFKNKVNDLLNKGIYVVDFALENVEIINHEKMFNLPFQYNEMEVNKLKKYIINEPKKYDVVVIGTSDRRKNICQKLQEKGLKVVLLDFLWGDERDKIAAQAKLLLNVHFGDSYNIYESLRCDRWVYSGMPVVSETSINNQSLDINEIVIFKEYNHLVDQVVEIIQNYDSFYENYMKLFNQTIDKIKENRFNKLNHIFNIINVSYPEIDKEKIPNKTLELFSANWCCNFQKPSFVKLGDTYFNLIRGYNILLIKDGQLIYDRAYDSCVNDCSFGMQKYIKQLIDDHYYDYLIMITHDDACGQTNPSVLKNLLIFLDLDQLPNLKFRASYLLLYNLKKNEIVKENCDNQFPIHEWFEVCDKADNYELKDMGIPVYIISYNLYYFVDNFVKQLEKYTKNIHIIDNKSTYQKLLNYYDHDYKYFLHRMPMNCGHLVWKNQMYWQFPRIFAISDPDLELNPKLPDDFMKTLVDLTYKYQKGKVGFALDISDSDKFFQDRDYTQGETIYGWEIRFWIKDVDHPDYELYEGSLDTTFCIVNKTFNEVNNAIRIAGNYTCKHLPWYSDWYLKLDPEEWNYYCQNNISSTTTKMINRVKQYKHNEIVDIYSDVYNLNQDMEKINNNITDNFKNNLNKNLTYIKEIKDIISENIEMNL